MKCYDSEKPIVEHWERLKEVGFDNAYIEERLSQYKRYFDMSTRGNSWKRSLEELFNHWSTGGA